MSWQTILAIGSGGFIGAILRVYVNGLISHKLPHDLPYGTLGVNLIGSFLMGVFIAYFMYTTAISLHIKSFISTGILGAFTTYSTFAIESFILLNSGHIVMGLTNMFLNTFGSVMMAGGGFYFIKYLMR